MSERDDNRPQDRRRGVKTTVALLAAAAALVYLGFIARGVLGA